MLGDSRGQESPGADQYVHLAGQLRNLETLRAKGRRTKWEQPTEKAGGHRGEGGESKAVKVGENFFKSFQRS